MEGYATITEKNKNNNNNNLIYFKLFVTKINPCKTRK